MIYIIHFLTKEVLVIQDKEFDMETYKELKESCQKIADILQDKYNPHTEVVIRINEFIIKEDYCNGYLKEDI